MSEAEGGAKPSFFGKMYNFVKTVAERAMDPDAIPSDDENGNDSDNDNGDDPDTYTVDFRQKFVPGNTVKIELDSAQDTEVAPAQNDPVDELNVDALAIESAASELELELESATADASPVPTEGTSGSKGFVGRSTGVSFCTRVGPNYKTNKQKAPSAPALMELMSADFVRTPCRVPDIGRYLDIPVEWSALDTHHPGVPPLFIVHAQIPNKWPTTVFVETTDGPCYSFILVYRLTQETADALVDLSTAPAAVKLFAQYCLENYATTEEGIAAAAGLASVSPSAPAADSDGTAPGAGASASTSASAVSSKGGSSSDWIGRTKVFVRCDNLNELKLPKFLHTYNAKPALIRESGTLIRGNGYLELDVNIKKFGLLANKTLPLLLSRLHLMDLHIGICVESREEEEMPEGMMGCVRVHKITADVKAVPMWFVRKTA